MVRYDVQQVWLLCGPYVRACCYRVGLCNRTVEIVCVNGIACVPHGFRSSFRNWTVEAGYSREVAETALAHSVSKNQVEGSYLSTDLFDRRRELMQAWSDYIL